MHQTGWGRYAVTRRGVVMTGGVIAAGVVVSVGGAPIRLTGPLEQVANPWDGSTRVERIRRASDLMVANLIINKLDYVLISGSPHLKAASTEPGFLALVLPPQSVGEELYSGSSTPSPPYKAEYALPTVLGFAILPGAAVPYSIDGLLDLQRTKVNNTDSGGIATSIEAPYRLRVRPGPHAEWINDTAPKKLIVGGVAATELWHTRLAAREEIDRTFGEPDPRIAAGRVVRVTESLGSGPIDTSIGELVRDDIVLNADVDTPVHDNGQVVRAPVAADLLLLSSLGASVDLHGSWPAADSVTAWDHRMTLGRDNYVRIVEKGWIAPYRHPATLITELYREFHRYRLGLTDEQGWASTAVLGGTATLIIADPVADTSLADTRGAGGLEFPFTSVRCTQRVTSMLVADPNLQDTGGVPRVRGNGTSTTLRLPFVGTDHAGNLIPFTSAVRFVPQRMLEPPNDTSESWELWDGEVPGVRTASVPGLDVRVAPEHPDHPGLTTVPVSSMIVKVQTVAGATPPWRPRTESLFAVLPAISALSGTAGDPVPHRYHPRYVTDENNPGGVILEWIPPAGEADEGSSVDPKSTGGLVAMPAYRGMSRKAGAVMAATSGGLDELSKGVPDIAGLFGDIQLIGSVTIAQIVPDLVAKLGNAVEDFLPAIPGVTHQVVDNRVIVDMDVELPLKKKDLTPFLKFYPGGYPLRLKAHSEAGAGGPAEVSIDARLREVALEFAGMIVLPITELRAQISGSKPIFTFELGSTRFLGPLAFLQPLAQFVEVITAADSASADANSNGAPARYTDRTGTQSAAPAVTAATGGALEGVDAFIDEAGLHLVAEFNVPDVAVGVFTLTGMNFGVGVDLPFGGGLVVHAFFASHENPFTVTYSGFGGTGYVDVQVINGSRQIITASLGVAATLGVDLVVASGSLSVNVGFILKVDNDNSPGGEREISIAAYFRISGAVSVPLICTVSVVFELALEFRPGLDGKKSKLTGTARFLLKVDTCLIDEDVEARLSRTFEGGPSLPALGGGKDPFADSWAAAQGALVMAGPSRTLAGDFEGSPTFRTTHPDATTWSAYASAFAKDPL